MACVAIACVAIPPHSKAYAAVVINEMLPKPSDGENQWIELYNTGDSSISMNQWTIQNTKGETKTFTLNASALIDAHKYYLITKSQSGIKMDAEGDTLKLVDDHNTTIDTQSYPGILGFNTSQGRSPDGGPSMTTCTTQTPNAANDCPAPTPTPTPPPATLTSTPVPTPTYAPIAPPVENVSQITNNPSDESIPRIIQPRNILGALITPTLTPTPTLPPDVVKIEIPNSFIVSKITIVQIIIILGAWGLLATVAYINKRRHKQIKKSSNHPVS